jgi:hypothetical protein
MTAIDVVFHRTGKLLGTIDVLEGDVVVTGVAESMLDRWRRRQGPHADRAFVAKYTSWSNGYWVTRPHESSARAR